MRTTLVIEDGLLRQAKHRAAERDLTVSEVVNEALRDAFRHEPQVVPRFRMTTYGQPDPPVTHDPDDFADVLELDDRSALGR